MPEPLTSRGPPTCWRPGCPSRSPPLARLAYNYRWSWTPGGPELFQAVDPDRWERCGENPVRLLQEADPALLERAAADPALHERIAAVQAEVEADLARPDAEGDSVAYFCAEFGVHRSLPIYSGGLGALAGDILKEASDLALPLIAVGLMYRQGYFRQRIDAGGWQHEYWVDTDPERLPAALVRGDDGEPVTITLPVRDMEVVAQIWRVDVGRVALYLLDTERPENSHLARWITSRLYIGDPDARLAQYVLLGAGGVRALAALGQEPELLHLNEGHGAFVSLEAARAHGGSLEDGLAATQAADDLHHAHAGPGRQRHVSRRPGRGGARGAHRRDGRRRRGGHPARPHPARGRRASRSA